MDLKIRDKVAVVTASSKGLGKSRCRSKWPLKGAKTGHLLTG